MLNLLVRTWLVVLGLLVGTGACSDSDSDAHGRRDAAQGDAASGRDAGILDAAPAEDAAARSVAGMNAPADSGVKAMDASVDMDAATEKDASTTQHDAGHDSGNPDDEDSGSSDAGAGPPPSEDTFSMRVVAAGLDAPWEITWGPDSRLWITERTGGRVIRMEPATGSHTL